MNKIWISWICFVFLVVLSGGVSAENVDTADSGNLWIRPEVNPDQEVMIYNDNGDDFSIEVISSTVIYNYEEYESSLDTYVRWSSDIRTQYPRTGEPIGEGREGYYWRAPTDYAEVGWCSELLCNAIYQRGFEIFDFPLSIDPITIDSATIKIQTYTPTDKSWWQQVGFDVYINDVKAGSGVSATRGGEEISEIIIDPSVLKEGLNNIFVVYNGPQSGYGQISLSRWIQLDYIIKVKATIDIDPDTLNLKSHKMMRHGRWVTAYIELPEGYDVADINVSMIRLGRPPVTSTVIYNYEGYESSLDTYMHWSSDIRTQYPRTGEPIGEGREGYYWRAPTDYAEVGWCSELLCNAIYQRGFEIFDFPLSIDPITIDSATIKIQTYTPTDKSWWQQVGFDVYINDVKAGSGVSATRGGEEISEIIIDPSVLKEGLNNIFVVYNGPQSGYGQISLSRWIQLDYIIKVKATIDIDPDTLHLKSNKMMRHGRWVTSYIELPEGYDVADINVSTIKLGRPPVTSTVIYSYGEYESSLDTYVHWSSDIRTRYPRTGEPIGEGRGGYYWRAPADYVEVGWCSELLCNAIYQRGFEIFDFPLSIDPTTINSATIKIQTYTPTDKSWWQQVGFDVYINDVKAGSGVSATRGGEEISEIIIDPSVLKEGLNNIFVVYNGPQSGYGQISLSRWVQLDYITAYSIPAKLHPSDIGDYDNDGIPDLMVKFDRADVVDLVETLNIDPPADIELTVEGSLVDGTPFEGSDTIRVIEKSKKGNKK